MPPVVLRVLPIILAHLDGNDLLADSLNLPFKLSFQTLQVSGLSDDLRKIAAKGVQVKYDASRTHMQHNFFIAEGEMLGSGSFSWSQRAARYNRENLIIYQDPLLVGIRPY